MNRLCRPAVFLDRDGTLIEDVGYLSDPAALPWLSGTAAALRHLQEQFALFVVTNQPGIARGALTAEDVRLVNEALVTALAAQGVRIEGVYVCPHDRREGCGCVKPNPFFLHLAAREHGVDLFRSFVVGDHPHDIAFAAAGGARGVYVLTGHGRRHLPELESGAGPVVPGLPEAARWILAEAGRTWSSPRSLDAAASLLRAGGLVAFPTETVYGLGANAFGSRAVARVFEVKGRPRFDPLIVHVADFADLDVVAADVPPLAKRLARAFWPGPLTLVLPKHPGIPDLVTAGLPTVAVRVPAHPVAQELLRRAGVPVAAPSANRFGRISPTRACHVVEELGDGVDLVLDGGPCRVGVESTIVSVTGGAPRLLRAGGVTLEELASFVDPVLPSSRDPAPVAPGSLPAHYAPDTPLVISRRDDAGNSSGRVGLLAYGPLPEPQSYAAVEVLSAGRDPVEAAVNLFEALRRLDRLGLDRIVAEPLPETGLGVAIMDRLRRAAHGSQAASPVGPAT